MTKEELLAELTLKTFVTSVGEPRLDTDQMTEPAREKLYVVNVKQIENNTCSCVNVYFYVFDEGQPGEVAYYKDQEPSKVVDGTVKS